MGPDIERREESPTQSTQGFASLDAATKGGIRSTGNGRASQKGISPYGHRFFKKAEVAKDTEAKSNPPEHCQVGGKPRALPAVVILPVYRSRSPRPYSDRETARMTVHPCLYVTGIFHDPVKGSANRRAGTCPVP